MFAPVPVVSIAAVDMPSGLAADWADLDARIVLDGLSVRWGREDILSQPEPGTGSLALFDPTRVWAVSRDLVGSLVSVRYVGTGPDGVAQSHVFYKGRIDTVRASLKTVLDPTTGREVRGTLVELTTTSRLADLANRWPAVDWPAETLGARASRIHDGAVSAGVLAGTFVRDYWKTPQVGPVTVANQKSLLEHLVALFDSCGVDRMAYYPHEDGVRFVSRREYTTVRAMAQLWWDVSSSGTARAGKGAYARAIPHLPDDYDSANGAPGVTALYLDADFVDYPQGQGIFRGPASRVSRAEVSHSDAGAGYAARVVQLLIPGVDEATDGTRSARAESIIVWNPWVDVAAGDLRDFIAAEGSRWSLEPLVYRSRLAGGFETVDQARWFLFGGETSSLCFLQGSWLPELRQRPIYGLLGAEVTYTRAGWEIAANLAPVTTTQTQHPITWEEIDAGTPGYELQWHDGDHPRGLHESLTYEDIGFVGQGLGVTSTPADQGWDFYA
jgi:hypothetical protein